MRRTRSRRTPFYALLPFRAYADRCLGPNDCILLPAFLPEVQVWARHPFAGGQIVFQARSLATVLHTSSDGILVQFDGFARDVHEHLTDIPPAPTDERRELRLAFDERLADGRDPETGWYCYR